MAFYRCSYILRTGKVCNRGCYRPEGCKVHWDSPPRVPCKECGKLTYSDYDYCNTHADKYRRRYRYQQKKLEKMAQNGVEEPLLCRPEGATLKGHKKCIVGIHALS